MSALLPRAPSCAHRLDRPLQPLTLRIVLAGPRDRLPSDSEVVDGGESLSGEGPLPIERSDSGTNDAIDSTNLILKFSIKIQIIRLGFKSSRNYFINFTFFCQLVAVDGPLTHLPCPAPHHQGSPIVMRMSPQRERAMSYSFVRERKASSGSGDFEGL